LRFYVIAIYKNETIYILLRDSL